MRTHLSITLASLLALAGCKTGSGGDGGSTKQFYNVDITYTEFGTPHIKAADFASLGFGTGYAQAADNLCTLSEQVLKLNGEKSRWFGPGAANKNLFTDVGYKALDLPGQAAQLYGRLSPDARDMLEGYVAGFNHSLASRGSPARYPSPCRGAAWVAPITPVQLLAYHLDLALLSSGRTFLSAMAQAQPPSAAKLPTASTPDANWLLTSEGIGSNGWALGAERSADARSMLLANPHFPWDGELRFFEQHLQIPGKLNIFGASMVGFPAVLIGFNPQLGWTHTVSQSKRSTLYQLQLDPQNPLRYRYGDGWRDITSRPVTVQVLQADGSLRTHTQPVYYSHYGPMVNLSSVSSQLGWTQNSAVSFRDANSGNYKMLDQWLDMARAGSTEEFLGVMAKHQGTPWVNTLLVDRQGQATYIDATQVPQLGPYAEQWWKTQAPTPAMAPLWLDGEGSVLLPGDDPRFEWVDSGDTRVPGLTPFAKAPRQTRRDYVFNSNSSHWLSNLDAPLTGYSMLYGPEHTVRSPRTRYNALLVSQPHTLGLTGPDQRFTLDGLQRVVTHNGSLFARDMKDDLVARCNATSHVQLDGQTVDISLICSALANWDGHYQLDSRGAHAMREWLTGFRVKGHRDIADALFRVPFDPNDAAHTPRGLATWSGSADTDPALLSLARAQLRLQQAGIALDARLGDVQFLQKARGQAPIPMPGGNSFEGLFNLVQVNSPSRSTSDLANTVIGDTVKDTTLRSLTDESSGQTTLRYRANYGSSFVMALQYGDAGPSAVRFLSYGQSHDPESPHFTDQTLNFSRQQWQPVRFSDADIATHQQSALSLRVAR